jgi:trans-2,3-dihydro-3-hydroxyanthranilate isomerase
LKTTRRDILFTAGAAGFAAGVGTEAAARDRLSPSQGRRYRYVHVDVFSAEPLLGNPLDVFLDARGMSDAQMLAVTRESYLSEVTFVFPRDAAIERKHGVHVRIFTPDGEVPFAGHPTLGTAWVLRSLRSGPAGSAAQPNLVTLDLKIGKIPVTFLKDDLGQTFGEMRQAPPVFGAVHDKATVAQLHNLKTDDIADLGPIQTVSTGLPFAIVPLKRLSALQSLRLNDEKMNAYAATQEPNFGFYYVTQDTGETGVGLRSRCVFVGGEDAATGSAAGCTAAWMVRYGVAAPEQSVHLRQGVEMKRPSDLFVRASRDGDKIVNIRVAGYVTQTRRGELVL